MKRFFLVLLLMLAASGAEGAWNVRSFGARGDGVADDTVPIQKALLAAASAPISGEVVFPAGTYRITRPLLVPNGPAKQPQARPQKLETVHLRGEKGAVVVQENPANDIFYFDWCFRVLVEGLTLKGGNRQLKFWTGNTDSCRITVRGCVFENAAGAAVDDSLRKDTGREDWLAVLPPCDFAILDDGMVRLSPRPEEKYPFFYFTSTLMHIEDCRFADCARVLTMTTDWAFMQNCLIRTGERQRGETIVSAGHLFLEDCRVEAPEDSRRGRIFIRKTQDMNPDGVNLRRVEFTGSWEYILRNECEFQANQANFLVAEECRFPQTVNPEGALFEWIKLPNQILLCDNVYANAKPLNYYPNAPYPDDFLHVYTSETFSYVGDAQMNLLPVMEKMRGRVLSGAERKQIRNGRLPHLSASDLARRVDKSFHLLDFGNAGNGRESWSAFQAAVDAAGRHSHGSALGEVVIPPGNYLLERSVVLPGNVAIRGEGTVYIRTAPKASYPAFTGKNIRTLLMQKLNFQEGAAAAVIANTADLESELIFDNLDAKSCSDYAIQIQCGDGSYPDCGRTRATISDSTFIMTKVLKHNARTTLNCVWISSDPDAVASGAIRNNGELYFNALVGVPILDRIYRSGKKEDTRNNDHRWIDNFGNIALDRCRFGGEFGGMPAIVNRRSGARVIVCESWLYHFSGNPRRLTHLDCEAMPELISLYGNLGWFGPASFVRFHAPADLSVIHESGNLPASIWEVPQ